MFDGLALAAVPRYLSPSRQGLAGHSIVLLSISFLAVGHIQGSNPVVWTERKPTTDRNVTGFDACFLRIRELRGRNLGTENSKKKRRSDRIAEIEPKNCNNWLLEVNFQVQSNPSNFFGPQFCSTETREKNRQKIGSPIFYSYVFPILAYFLPIFLQFSRFLCFSIL